MFIKPQINDKDLSKDRTKDIVVHRLMKCTNIKLKDRDILGNSPGEPTFRLGRYLTQQRALEVFQTLEESIASGKRLFKMPND